MLSVINGVINSYENAYPIDSCNDVRPTLHFTIIHWAGYYLGLTPLFRGIIS
jgi:hypothetical protein